MLYFVILKLYNVLRLKGFLKDVLLGVSAALCLHMFFNNFHAKQVLRDVDLICVCGKTNNTGLTKIMKNL